jgi:hypothetical protein
MDNLLLALAAILALNVGFGVRIAFSELRSRRRIRREVDVLESMWRHDPDPAERVTLRSRLAGRATAVAAAVVMLSGVAIATPAGDAVVSTFTGVVNRLTTNESQFEASAPGPRDSGAGSSEATSPEPDAPGVRPDGTSREPHANGEGGQASTPPAPIPSEGQDPAPTETPVPSLHPTPTESVAPAAFGASASARSSTEIELSWNDLPTATGYVVESPDGLGGWTTVTQLPDGEMSTIVTELTPDTTYEFRVRATTESGDVVSDVTSATTPSASAAE